MSLFDLRDVCIAIGSLATLDLPMVVDLIGIYGLKGPYCTLTTTDWFLQALSVIPRGSWGDVARRFTMIRWAESKGWRLKLPATACGGAIVHARARAQPRDRPAHSLRTTVDQRPLIHVRVSHVAGRGSRKVARRCMWRGCALVALHAGTERRRCALRWPQACDGGWPFVARRWGDDAGDGRRLNAHWPRDRRMLVERHRATLAVEARC
ncbi:hypothetical protein F511_44837 [Dorcoceras hygrometricum]|uniref:Acyl-CoA dehydrogenase-related protein n=1 Tax=Dorcoceras hygrometricum TaxID=472368 RepID=A0A2Z7BSZ5_9LAMI|nr:hypothetical protein F511_44837 [Dorcoceras hygrometricum]